VDEAEQDVLGPDEVVVKQARFFLGQDEDPSGTVSEALEHGSSQDRAPPGNREASFVATSRLGSSARAVDRHRSAARGWASHSLQIGWIWRAPTYAMLG